MGASARAVRGQTAMKTPFHLAQDASNGSMRGVVHSWGEPMQPNFADLAELAVICARRSRLVETESTANELWRLAKDYQERAAKLDHGTLPDIGNAPYSRAKPDASSICEGKKR